MTVQQRRAYQREYYRLTNQHRLGKRPGPAVGSTHVVDDSELATRIEAFREQKASERSSGNTTLPTTCEFCSHLSYRHDMSQQFCDREREPDGSGRCSLWEGRYAVRPEPEDLMGARAMSLDERGGAA